jgi:hypothetical protein
VSFNGHDGLNKMTFKDKKINYKELSGKDKESYCHHKMASFFADRGYDSQRLFNDSNGADFIAISFDKKEVIKVQSKSMGGTVMDKKYIGKDIYMCYMDNDYLYLYLHDEYIEFAKENMPHFFESKSWIEKGTYFVNGKDISKLVREKFLEKCRYEWK